MLSLVWFLSLPLVFIFICSIDAFPWTPRTVRYAVCSMVHFKRSAVNILLVRFSLLVALFSLFAENHELQGEDWSRSWFDSTAQQGLVSL